MLDMWYNPIKNPQYQGPILLGYLIVPSHFFDEGSPPHEGPGANMSLWDIMMINLVPSCTRVISNYILTLIFAVI